MHVYTRQYTRRESTPNVYVENPREGKTTGVHQTPTITTSKIYTIEEQQGQRPPAHYLHPQAAVTTENVLCVVSYHSLSQFSCRDNDLIQK